MLFSYAAIADDSEHHLNNDARIKLRMTPGGISRFGAGGPSAAAIADYQNLHRKILL